MCTNWLCVRALRLKVSVELADEDSSINCHTLSTMCRSTLARDFWGNFVEGELEQSHGYLGTETLDHLSEPNPAARNTSQTIPNHAPMNLTLTNRTRRSSLN